MHNKIVLITGSTDGIGKASAKEFAKKGATVIVHGRDQNRTYNTVNEIVSKTGNNKIYGITADFNSFSQVKKMSEEIKSNFEKIDIFFNNAAFFSSERVLSENKNEITFQVNHLAAQLLTIQIQDLLINNPGARIINVSSMIHSAQIDFDNLNGEKSYNGNSAYALSKLCNILFTNKLADLYSNNPVTVNSLHPGVIETKLLNAAWTGGAPLSDGVYNMYYAASSEVIKDSSGLYLENGRPMQSNPISYDTNIQNKLWDISMSLINNYL